MNVLKERCTKWNLVAKLKLANGILIINNKNVYYISCKLSTSTDILHYRHGKWTPIAVSNFQKLLIKL